MKYVLYDKNIRKSKGTSIWKIQNKEQSIYVMSSQLISKIYGLKKIRIDNEMVRQWSYPERRLNKMQTQGLGIVHMKDEREFLMKR